MLVVGWMCALWNLYYRNVNDGSDSFCCNFPSCEINFYTGIHFVSTWATKKKSQYALNQPLKRRVQRTALSSKPNLTRVLKGLKERVKGTIVVGKPMTYIVASIIVRVLPYLTTSSSNISVRVTGTVKKCGWLPGITNTLSCLTVGQIWFGMWCSLATGVVHGSWRSDNFNDSGAEKNVPVALPEGAPH